MYIYTMLSMDCEDRRPNHQMPPLIKTTVGDIAEMLQADLLAITRDEEDIALREETDKAFKKVIESLVFTDDKSSLEFDMPIIEEYWIITRHEV